MPLSCQVVDFIGSFFIVRAEVGNVECTALKYLYNTLYRFCWFSMYLKILYFDLDVHYVYHFCWWIAFSYVSLSTTWTPLLFRIDVNSASYLCILKFGMSLCILKFYDLKIRIPEYISILNSHVLIADIGRFWPSWIHDDVNLSTPSTTCPCFVGYYCRWCMINGSMMKDKAAELELTPIYFHTLQHQMSQLVIPPFCSWHRTSGPWASFLVWCLREAFTLLSFNPEIQLLWYGLDCSILRITIFYISNSPPHALSSGIWDRSIGWQNSWTDDGLESDIIERVTIPPCENGMIWNRTSSLETIVSDTSHLSSYGVEKYSMLPWKWYTKPPKFLGMRFVTKVIGLYAIIPIANISRPFIISCPLLLEISCWLWRGKTLMDMHLGFGLKNGITVDRISPISNVTYGYDAFWGGWWISMKGWFISWEQKAVQIWVSTSHLFCVSLVGICTIFPVEAWCARNDLVIWTKLFIHYPLVSFSLVLPRNTGMDVWFVHSALAIVHHSRLLLQLSCLPPRWELWHFAGLEFWAAVSKWIDSRMYLVFAIHDDLDPRLYTKCGSWKMDTSIYSATYLWYFCRTKWPTWADGHLMEFFDTIIGFDCFIWHFRDAFSTPYLAIQPFVSGFELS